MKRENNLSWDFQQKENTSFPFGWEQKRPKANRAGGETKEVKTAVSSTKGDMSCKNNQSMLAKDPFGILPKTTKVINTPYHQLRRLSLAWNASHVWIGCEDSYQEDEHDHQQRASSGSSLGRSGCRQCQYREWTNTRAIARPWAIPVGTGLWWTCLFGRGALPWFQPLSDLCWRCFSPRPKPSWTWGWARTSMEKIGWWLKIGLSK